MIRVLVADDHAMVRAGLAELLRHLPGIEVVGEANDGLEALKLVHALSPDIALLDIAMPGLTGIEAAARIAKERPETKVILISMFGSEVHLRKSLEAHVSGYLLKGADVEELSRAILAVHAGNVYLMPAVAKYLTTAIINQPPMAKAELEQLTPRQREVLLLIVEGFSAKEIAFRLKLSSKTIDAHRFQIMNKLKIYDIPGLVRFAIRNGLTQDPTSDSSIQPR